MQQAIAAARAARGRTSPNPWVGAVLVRDGRVLATGATAPPGGPHAEAAALANVDGRGTTLYTTLEPCMPFEGKRTRPCAEAIVEAGIERVVIGLIDPHAPVAGQGVDFLRSRGLEVEVGDGAEEIERLLRPYLVYRRTGRPYVIAKFAVSLDGMVAAPSQGITWLTGPAAVERAHQDRAWIDAIAVGSGTVLADDPALTARPGGVLSDHQPLRVIVDGRGRTPLGAKALGPGAIVATSAGAREWQAGVAAAGATVVQIESNQGRLDLEQLLQILGRRSVMSLILEGGPTVLASAFEQELVNEVHAYIAPIVIGPSGVPLANRETFFAPQPLRNVEIEVLSPDVLVRGYTGDAST